MRNMRLRAIIALCFVLVAEVALLANSKFARASERFRYFPETDQAITDPNFLEYWENNGGLSRFGYPLAGTQVEDSTLSGTDLIVQYFERAEMEWYTKHGSPPVVALTLLGTLRYKDKYQGNAPNQKPNLSPYSILIPETGKRIGGRFLQYWTNNGSTAQFGNPISDEIQEVSELDGREYTMQYFERAVMELHPNNAPPYDVQLSQLGRFRHDTLYGSSDQLPVNTRILGMGISVETLSNSGPVIVGHQLFYLRATQRNICICSYDVMLGQETQIVSVPFAPQSITNLVADEDTIAWIQDLSSVHTYDRASKVERTILQADSQTFSAYRTLAVDKGALYYQDLNPNHLGLFKYELSSHRESLISSKGSAPVAQDGLLLFSNSDPTRYATSNLLLMKEGQLRVIATAEWVGFSNYTLTSKYVVWAGGIGAQDRAVYLYNIETQTKTKIASDATRVSIYGDLVASDAGFYMVHNPPPGGAIRLYNAKSKMSSGLVSNNQYEPHLLGIIEGKWLLYMRGIGYNQATHYGEVILYMMQFNP